jgi:hypothetical protein
MSFLIQHGFGKGQGSDDKIYHALHNHIADGVIFSPDAQTRESLENYIRELLTEFQDIQVLIDPQIYVATLDNPNYKQLTQYTDVYYESNLTRRSFSPRFTQSLVRRTFEWQHTNNITSFISPGVRIRGLRSPWAQIAFTLAQESCDYKHEQNLSEPLYITLAIAEESFRDFDLLNQFLDEITTLETDGFYLLIFQAGSDYGRSMDSTVLSNFLYFLYSLGEINQFNIIVGFADLCGYLFRTVGAQYFASGWSHNQRLLSKNRWCGGGGGRQPLPRYTSLQLLNTILVSPELRSIHREGQIQRVISNTLFDRGFSRTTPIDDVPWTKRQSQMQYLSVCSQLDQRINPGNIIERCQSARSLINSAHRLYVDLQESNNIVFSPESGSRHLIIWLQALDEFCTKANIQL